MRLIIVLTCLTTLHSTAFAQVPIQPSPTELSAPAASKTDKEVKNPFTYYGDFRIRNESNFELDSQPDHNRVRVRIRLGGQYKFSDDLMIGARITTGKRTDPNSPHQTLGEGFHRFELNLDRAFIMWTPANTPGLAVYGGKFAHSFWRNPVYGELIWDTDVQPEGVAAVYTKQNVGFLDRLTLSVSEYSTIEQKAGTEAGVFAAQISAHTKKANNLSASVAVGYYDWSNQTPDGADTVFKDNGGNATVDTDGDTVPDAFKSTFEIVHGIAAINYYGWKKPISLAGEFMINGGADERDLAYAVGASVGALKDRGDWKAYYSYVLVEQDSVFSAVAGDDFLFQTNHRSHVAGIKYQFREKANVHLWTLISARELTDPTNITTDKTGEQWRVRLTLNFTF